MVSFDLSKTMSSIAQIRNAVDHITISGHENCELVSFIHNSCNELLKQLGTTMEDLYKQKEESKRKEDNPNDANQNFS